jgi:hypothetical protein
MRVNEVVSFGVKTAQVSFKNKRLVFTWGEKFLRYIYGTRQFNALFFVYLHELSHIVHRDVFNWFQDPVHNKLDNIATDMRINSGLVTGREPAPTNLALIEPFIDEDGNLFELITVKGVAAQLQLPPPAELQTREFYLAWLLDVWEKSAPEPGDGDCDDGEGEGSGSPGGKPSKGRGGKQPGQGEGALPPFDKSKAHPGEENRRDVLERLAGVANHVDFDQLSENEQRRLASEIYAQLKEAQKQAGNTPSPFDALIEEFGEFCEPKLTWQDRVQNFVRMGGAPLVQVRYTRLGRYGTQPATVVIPAGRGAILADSSGSVGNADWSSFFDEMYGIKLQLSITLDIIPFDGEPGPLFEDWDPRKGMGKFRERAGGTMFAPPFIALCEGEFAGRFYRMWENYTFAVLMTDGYPCDGWPEESLIRRPTLVVTTNDVEVPSYLTKVLLK